MSRWDWSARGGGISPFTSTRNTQGNVPAVTDDDYSYITSEDLENHGFDLPSPREASGRDDRHVPRSTPGLGAGASGDKGKTEDDVLLIRHKGVTYPEHFPPYSIGDEKLKASDVTERVKIIMQLSDRQAALARLFYKGCLIDDPRRPVSKYGVKDNSEIMVVLLEPDSDESGNSSEEVVVVSRDQDSSKKGKKHKRKSKKRGDKSPRSGSRHSRLSFEEDQSGASSRVQQPQPSSTSPAGSHANHANHAAPPGSPMHQLDTIASHFTTKLLPLCVQFTAKPPSSPKGRSDEHRKLSETVMQQVLLKLDGVDIQGDEAARTRRKELVRQVQEVLKGIDGKVQG